MQPPPFSTRTRAARLHRTWVKARRAPREHLAIVHPDGAIDCVCERSVWYVANRTALGHRHHCEICHPRDRHGSTRTRVKHCMMSSGLLPQHRHLKTAFYRSSLDLLRNTPVRELIAALRRDGCSSERQTRAGGRIYGHPDGRRTTIHDHTGRDTLTRKTLRSVLQATRWTEDNLRRLGLLT